MRIIKWLVLIVVLLSAAGFVAWRFLQPPLVNAVRPTRGPAVEAVYATGLVEPTLEIRIAPRIGGRLVELLAFEGDQVREGQLLARLEDTDLRAAVAELEAKREYAEALAKRNAELVRSGLIPRDTAERSSSDLDAVEASLARARDQVRQMRIIAPADGRIIRRDGEVGEFIPVNEPIFYLAGEAPLRITAEVDEEDVPRLRVGLPVVIRSDAFPDKVFDGRVAQITPRGDPVSRSYRVRIELVGSPPLRVGMTTETNIIVGTRENALLVPASAVTDGAVWVAREGHAVRQAVETGVVGPRLVEVLGGLDGSEIILESPPEDLEAGDRIRLAEAS